MDVKARLVPVPVLVDTPPMVHEYLAAELRDGGSSVRKCGEGVLCILNMSKQLKQIDKSVNRCK
jgi:hypothetical protein